MRLKRRKDSPYWWMSFMHEGILYRESTGTTDKKEAQRIYAKALTKLYEGKTLDDEARNHTFDELMDKYLSEYSKLYNAESTYKKDLAMLKNMNPTFSGLTLDQITSRVISTYKTKRLSKKAAPATVRNELRLLSHAFNVAMKSWEWVKDNPVSKAGLKELKARTIDRWLTEDEEAKLMKAAEGKLYGQLVDIIVLALNTGLSQEQILKLQWKDIDMTRGTIATIRKKTGEARTLPINSTVLNLLARRSKVRHINKSEYVFFNGAGNKIDAGKLKASFVKTVREAGIAHFRFHDLRHTFGSRLTQRGVDLYKISKLMLHKNISTTERYAHHYPESLRDGVKILDKLHMQQDNYCTFTARLN
jgi:site-specific recombinase XerD